MNIKAVGYYLGHILLIEAVFMLPAFFIALAQAETSAAYGFVWTIAILVCGGLLLQRFKSATKKGIFAREGFVTVALAWVVMSALGALPFLISQAIPNYIDCLFETISGFTTTGASILTNVEALPMSLLYWRSFTHWLGGMGILVFMLAVVSFTKGSGEEFHLIRAESPGPMVGKLAPRIRHTAMILYGIYVAMTLIEMLMLMAGGMPFFDSITTAFATAGTGGFSIKNASMAAYPSYYLQGTVAVFMVLFGVNFNVFYFVLIRELRAIWRSEEFRLYIGLLVASVALVTINVLSMFEGVFQAFHHSFFQVASIMTTTGFATTDFNLWPEFARCLLVVLMLVGASAGSTGGGIKVSRILIMLKSIKSHVQKLLHPRSVRVIKMDGQTIDATVISSVNSYLGVYALIVIFSTLVLAFDNFDMVTTTTAVLACINNIGPGLNLVGPLGNYSEFSVVSKIVLCLNMLIGRLEIFPMLMLVLPSVWRRDKR